MSDSSNVIYHVAEFILTQQSTRWEQEQSLAPAIRNVPRKQWLKRASTIPERLEMNAKLMTKGKAELCKTN